MNKRVFGQIGKLKKDRIEDYAALHADVWPEVLATIHRCNLRNYSIFLDCDTVFAYFEYIGEDYDRDMSDMAQDMVTQQWWKLTRPCFERFAVSADSEFYHDMRQIFYFE